MKKLLVIAVLLLNAGLTWSQEYTWAYMDNPDFTALSSTSSLTMVNGKLYHLYSNGTTSVRASVYNPESSSWMFLNQLTLATAPSRIQTVYKNNLLYFVASSTSDMALYQFNPANNTFATLSTPITAGMMNSNWQLKAGQNNDLYVLRVQNYSQVYLTRFDLASGLMTNNVDYSGLLNPSGGMGASSGQVELYISSSSIYCGLAANDDRLGVTTQATINTLTPYNTLGSNNGGIYINGSLSSLTQFYLVGDGINAPTMHVKDVSAVKTWTFPVGNTDINALSSNTPNVDFNVYQGAYATLEHPNYAYLMSSFQPVGGGPADKFYVYRQDLSSGLWDSLGPKIYPGDPFLNSGTLSMSLDNNEQHMSVQWASSLNNGEYEFSVLNRKPYINPGSETANTGICVGHANEIYPQLEYLDEDNDKVRIVNIYSQFGVISNLSAVPFGHYPGLPSTSKFKIYGTFTSSANDRVIITYTDGWNQFNDTLPVISTGASAPNVTFSSSPLIFCDNENMIDLANYVSYLDQGIFTFNGYELESSVIDGREVSLTDPNGTIYYRVSVGGCIVETGVTFSFVNAGTASTTSSPSACGSATGTANVIFTPGTSNNTTVEWSTGETTTSISNLVPGAYYYSVKDEYGCNVTGFANVGISGITATANVTNVTCHGANNGSIALTVNGSPDYGVLWSNGYSTTTISNLAPGNYEVTVYDAQSGCQATYSYTITEPTPITASFTTYEPDCGQSNGDIYGVYSGGAGNYTFDWIGQGQTTADLYGVTYGFYQVDVNDANGCSQTFGFQLDDYQAVDIIDSIIPTTCLGENGAILIKFEQDQAGGPSSATSFTWSNANLLLNNYNLAAGTYTIDVISGPSPFNGEMCHSGKTMEVGNRAPVAQPICLVTVDTATTTNLVIWEKVEYGIDHYNIYRENAVAGNFMLIDTVQFGSESLFNDVVASPIDRSWRYKISAVNACNVEGPVSIAHKTMHLNSIVNLGNGSNDIYWDDYEGLVELEYVVYRHSDQNGWEALNPAVPFGTSVFNDAPPVNLTGIDYYVDMHVATPCSAEKAQDFNSARSNKDKGQFSTGNGTGDSNNAIDELIGNALVSVYPNPFSDLLTIRIADATTEIPVAVYSVDGQLQFNGSFTNGTNVLNLAHLQAGIYLVKVGESHTMQFVKL
ncbi:MAG TPA: T9SS type A sorting domain-containing protein [Fluviicola sp.]|nr:T9SS type A sorting domain-containing protein [Fluviicola sp.]